MTARLRASSSRLSSPASKTHHTSLGPSGVFVALAVCFSVFAMIGVVLFRRGGWKLTRV